MTTTYDTEFSTETIAAPQFDDPDTYTVVEAWASSPLGDMGDDVPAAHTGEERSPAGSRAKLFAALAAGVIGGATLGAVLFGYKAVAPPTVVVPGFGVSTEQLPAAPSTPSSPTASQKPAAAAAQTPKPADQSAVPNPVAVESKTNEEVAATPNAPLDPGTPPVVAPPVVVDVYVPPLGEKPEPPTPQPPKPQPPVFDPPNIEAVPVPDEPNPEPPNIEVIEAPTLDTGLGKPTVTGLKPVEGNGSRFTTKLPANKPNPRQVNTSSRATLAKP
jgi:hypothetical protein